MRYLTSLALSVCVAPMAFADNPPPPPRPVAVVATAPIVSDEPEFPPLVEGFSSFGAATLDGFVYVYGGHAGKTHTYSTETTLGKFRRLNIANPATGWEELPSGPKVQGVALVANAGKVYRVGGMSPQNAPDEKSNNISLASVSMYDVKAGKWADLPAMPAARSSHDAVILNNKLYVFGGWAMNGNEKPKWHEDGAALDLAKPEAKWEAIKQPFARRALTAAAFENKIYIIAGMGSDANLDTSVNIYDPATNTWSKGTDLPGEKANGFTPAACVCEGKLYVSPMDGKIYRLDAESWKEVSALKNARFVHRVVPIGGGRMLAIAGASKQGNLADVEPIRVK